MRQSQGSTTFTPPLFRSNETFSLPNASSASSLAPTTIAGKSVSDHTHSALSSMTDRQRAFISPNSSMIHHGDEDVILNLGSLIGHSNESTTSGQRFPPLDVSTTALSESILTDIPNQSNPIDTSSRRGSAQSLQFLATGPGAAASPVTSGAPSPIIRSGQRGGSNLSQASNSNSTSECHLNIAWASEEDIPYARLPPGRTITVFAPNIRTPAEVFPSQHILVTKCTRMLPPNHAPLAHCAHYHYNRRCLRGDQCGFVHVARFQGSKPPLDPTVPSAPAVSSAQTFIAPQPTVNHLQQAQPGAPTPMVLYPSGSANEGHSPQPWPNAGVSLMPSFQSFAPPGPPGTHVQLQQSAPQYVLQQGQTMAIVDQFGNPTRILGGGMPQAVPQVQVAMPQQGPFPPQQFFSVYAPHQGGVPAPMTVSPGYQWPTPQPSPTSFQAIPGSHPAGNPYGGPMGMVAATGGNIPQAFFFSTSSPGQPTAYMPSAGAPAQPLSQFPRLG